MARDNRTIRAYPRRFLRPIAQNARSTTAPPTTANQSRGEPRPPVAAPRATAPATQSAGRTVAVHADYA